MRSLRFATHTKNTSIIAYSLILIQHDSDAQRPGVRKSGSARYREPARPEPQGEGVRQRSAVGRDQESEKALEEEPGQGGECQGMRVRVTNSH